MNRHVTEEKKRKSARGEETEKVRKGGVKERKEAQRGEEPGSVKHATHKKEEEKRDWEREYKELYDRFVRLHAEFENFKKRMIKDKEEAIRFANQALIQEILPFVDNLERSLEHADEAKNIHALREGIEMTLQQFLKTLEKSGLEPIQAKGEPFDPNVHEAIMQVETDEMDPHMVVDELQKGYKLHGRVIRPATVTVSKRKDS